MNRDTVNSVRVSGSHSEHFLGVYRRSGLLSPRILTRSAHAVKLCPDPRGCLQAPGRTGGLVAPCQHLMSLPSYPTPGHLPGLSWAPPMTDGVEPLDGPVWSPCMSQPWLGGPSSQPGARRGARWSIGGPHQRTSKWWSWQPEGPPALSLVVQHWRKQGLWTCGRRRQGGHRTL